jgi:predicted transcriptional regulator of viral defense system
MYNSFQQKMSIYTVFSVSDIEKEFPHFDKKNLVYWQKKDYLQKIRNNYYSFSTTPKDEAFLYLASNKIYSPSYISFESALAYYNVIPEGVYTITAVSTLKTNAFSTPLGNFTYKHIKPVLFFGYKLIKSQTQTFKMAELEKTILDYMYLSHKLTSSDDFEALRWNKEVLKQLNLNLLADYQLLFNSKALNNRVNHFLTYLNA